jgi:sulfite reductase (ferredoxin)
MTTTAPGPSTRPVPDKDPEKLSKVERIKAASRGLRGALVEQVEADTPAFSGVEPNLLKFHGIYQQDDRDARKANRGAGGGKAHSMMVRNKLPGGVMTAEQYLVHDDLAGRYGNATLRVTTRQDIQFHGVLKRDLKRTMRAINDTLVTTFGACGDVVRNVVCCPLPADGVRARVLEDTRALSDRLLPATTAYAEVWLDGERVLAAEEEAEPLYGKTYLPRKFKIALAFPGDNCTDVYSNDIGIVAAAEGDTVTGYTVLAGGGLGMTHGNDATYPRLADPICFVTPEELGDTVETIVAIQRDHGNRKDRKRARLKYVLDEWGVDAFREELSARLGRSLTPPPVLSWSSAGDHLGWLPQPDGRWALGVWVENGRILDTPAMRLRSGLRAVVERVRPGVRLTPQQNVLLTDIDDADRATVDALLREHGVRPAGEIPLVRRDAMACPALPTCGQALAEAERTLPTILDEVEALLAELGLAGEAISVRMTGCPNGCARPYLGDIGIVGRTLDKYTLFLGGDEIGTRLNRQFADLVPTAEITATLRPVLAAFRDQRVPGERFGDYCDRVGSERLQQLAGVSV